MPVLGTKLHVPAPRRQLVPRARLIDRLRAEPAALPRLVLVSAPAGFGKTTLLTQWLARGRRDRPRPGRGICLAAGGVVVPGRAATPTCAGSSPIWWPQLQTASPEVGLRRAGAAGQRPRPPGRGRPGQPGQRPRPARGPDRARTRRLPRHRRRRGPRRRRVPARPPAAPGHPRHHDPGGPAAAAVPAAGPRRAARASRRRPAVHRRRGRRVPQPGDGPGPRASPGRRPGGPDRGLGRRPAAGRPLGARPHRPSESAADGVERFVEAFTGSHRFVLDYLVEEVLATPARGRAAVPARHVGARAADRAVVRRAHRTQTTGNRCSRPWSATTCSWSRSTTSGSGTATTICSPTRCAPGSRPRTRPDPRPAPGSQRLVRRARDAGRRHQPRPRRRRRRACRRPPRARACRRPGSGGRTGHCATGCKLCPTRFSAAARSWPRRWGWRGSPRATSTGSSAGSTTPMAHSRRRRRTCGGNAASGSVG